MTDREIVQDFERREAEAGGAFRANPLAIARAVAEAGSVPVQRVRDVMTAHWTMGGAG